jgi:DNA-binding protein
MRIIFETATGNIIDWLESGKVSGLASGLQVINLPDYAGDKTETNIEDVPGGTAARAELNAIITRLSDQVDEINGKYAGLNISINDTVAEAGKKMIIAGVTWEDCDTYAGRLKNLKQVLLEVQ